MRGVGGRGNIVTSAKAKLARWGPWWEAVILDEKGLYVDTVFGLTREGAIKRARRVLIRERNRQKDVVELC